MNWATGFLVRLPLNLCSILGNFMLDVSIVRNSGVPTKIRTRGCEVRSENTTSALLMAKKLLYPHGLTGKKLMLVPQKVNRIKTRIPPLRRSHLPISLLGDITKLQYVFLS